MPSALQAVAWARRPLPFLERCQKQFGDTFTIRVRHSGTWVILSDPEDVRRVFTANHAALGVGVANSILGPLLGPRSVMLLEEPEHVRRRKLMLPPFHGERMLGYSEMMADVTRREVATWPIGEPFELWPRMQEITLEAIMRVVFGPVETQRLQLLRFRLRKLTNWMNDPRRLTLLAAAGPSRLAGKTDYRVMMGPVEDSVLEEVRRRQLTPECTDGSDIAAMLAEAHYEDGSPMTEQDLRDELVTLLTDGPTSSLLSWAFERILRHPEQLARLRAELDAGKEDAYLDAVVKETLRLCPAAPIVVRKLLARMELGRYQIPAVDSRGTRRADVICKRFYTELHAHGSSTAQDLAHNVPLLATYEQTEGTELSKLTPPSNMNADWKQILAGTQTLAGRHTQGVAQPKEPQGPRRTHHSRSKGAATNIHRRKTRRLRRMRSARLGGWAEPTSPAQPAPDPLTSTSLFGYSDRTRA